MQGFALVLFFLAIFFQFCEILSENQTNFSEASESQRPKRNHENDPSQYRKQVQSKTLNSKDVFNKKAQLFLVKDDTECYKQDTRKNNDLKNINRLVVDVHDGYGNNHQKHTGAKVMKVNPLSVNKNPKKGLPITVIDKENSVQKIAVESNTKKTPTATVAKHQHHNIVIVKANVKENEAKNKGIEDNNKQLIKQVDTANENKAQDVTYENSNTKTPSHLESEDLKSDNVMEIKEHKYEEIRITPTKYYPQADARHIKAIPDFNSEFGSDLSQSNPYQEMGYGYDENNNYYVCANNVDQGHQNCYTADFKRDPNIGNEEANFIKKTWLDTEIKIKMQNLNQENYPWYNNIMMNSCQKGASNALSNKLYQNSYQYFS